MSLYKTAEHPAPTVRQAALLLHAMPQPDRVWLLGKLPAAQRFQLTSLVEELQQLGMPKDPGLIDFAVAGGQESVPGVGPLPITIEEIDVLTQQRQFLEQLNTQGRVAISNLLRQEPPILVARLLTLGQWPWKDEVLGQLGAVKRRQIEEYCRTSVQGVEVNMLSATLIATVSEQLRLLLQQSSSQKSRESDDSTTSGEGRPFIWPQRLLRLFQRVRPST